MTQSKIKLRPSQMADLDLFFEFQLDSEGCQMAAFTSQDSKNKDAYLEKYVGLLNDQSVNMQTIFFDHEIAGSISKFVMFGDAEVTYWIDKKFWGKGIATEALKQLLLIEQTRPLFGRTAFDNLGSQKVLEKCGFKKIGSETSFANARNKEIEESIYKLS